MNPANLIYLDNAATTHPKPPSVYQAADEALRFMSANPGRGGHQLAIRASRLVFETRENLATLLGAPNPERIIFTSNATAAINMALFGVLGEGGHCVTSNIEHNAVIRPLTHLCGRGLRLSHFDVSESGAVDLEAFEALLTEQTKLVVFTHASNVSGAMLPVAELTRRAKARGIQVMLDASQSAGAFPLNVEELGVDFLACPGHKGLLGPQGTGLLYVSESVELSPFVFGGTGSRSEDMAMPDFYPDRMEAGTVNTPGLAGLNAGVRFLLEEGVGRVHEREQALLQQLVDGLVQIEGLRLCGPRSGSRAAVVSFVLCQHDPSYVGSALDADYGIASRVGLHCAPLAHRSLGTFPTGTVRLSPGYFTQGWEIERTLEAVREISQRPATRPRPTL